MAGTWLKVESSTPEKSEVLAITAAMGWDDPDLTVGKLFRVWRWFDEHTIDGNAPRVTSALLDRISGVSGFSQAMADVGWLAIEEGGLSLPNFDRHNGKTAKDRALTAKRVATHKGNAVANGEGNAASVSGALPREEKNREEKKEEQKTLDGFDGGPTDAAGALPATAPTRRPADYPDDFEIAWAAYPKRPGMNKKESHKAYAARVKSGHDPTLILAGVQRYAKFCVGTGKVNTEFVKQPATFFGPNEHFLEAWAFVAQPPKGPQGSKNGSLTIQNYRAGVAPNGAF